MKKFLLFGIALAFVLVACNDNLKPEEEKYVQFSLEVSLDTTGVATKTYMYDDTTSTPRVGKVKWSSTDYLTLYNISAYFVTGITSRTAQNISNDGKTAMFIFNVKKEEAEALAGLNNYLFYGDVSTLTVKTGISTLSFSISLPANQTHAGTNCFQEFENVAFGYCPSGTFKYEADSDKYVGTAGCVLRNAFGILKVPIVLTALDGSSVDPGTIRYVRLTDKNSGNHLAGTFNVTINTTGENVGAPTLSYVPSSGGDSRTIEKVITKTSPLSDANKFVYFLVPPETLFGANGFSLAVYTDDGYYGNKTITPSASSKIAIERSKITQLNIGPFTKKKYPDPEPLTANSYIFAASAGVGTFPAHYKGNGYQGNGEDIKAKSNEIAYSSDYYAEIMWQTKSNGETILAAEVIDSPVYYNTTSGPCISFHKSGVEGNALIALRDSKNTVRVEQLDGKEKRVDKILWSWHVWITDTPQEVEIVGDKTSFFIMDRNVGALSASPDGLSQFHGLAYQYGRKDPFMGSRFTTVGGSAYEAYASIYPPTGIWTRPHIGDSYALSVFSPNVRYMGEKAWVNDNTNVGWGSPSGDRKVVYPKTLVDPCPVGWKVVSEASLASVLGYADSTAHLYNKPKGEFVVSGDGYAFKLNNGDNPVYFPAAGSSVSHESIDNVGTSAMVWTATYDNSTSSTSVVHFNAFHTSFSRSTDGGFNLTSSAIAMKTTMPVRCQKYEEPLVTSENAQTTSSINKRTTAAKASEFIEEEEIELL